MSKLNAVKKEVPLSVKAYYIIREAIISNELKAGEVLTEENLAEKLQISRTPIRAALQRLQLENIVTVQEKNVVVSTITAKDMRDLNVVRQSLEPLAIRLLSETDMTDSQMDRLKKILDIQKSAINSVINDDYSLFLETEYDFHSYIGSLCGNQYLSDMIINVNVLARRALVLSGTLEKYAADALAEHLLIYETLCARKFEKAAEYMEEHINKVHRRILI